MVLRETTRLYLIHWGLLLCLVSEQPLFVSSALKGKNTDNVTSTSPEAKSFTFATSPRPVSQRGKGDYSDMTSKTSDSGMIVFPSPEDEEEETLPLRIGVKQSSKHSLNAFTACAKDSTVCDNVEGYPREKMEAALKSMGKSFQASVDVLDHDQGVVNRIGSNSNAVEENLCESSPQVMFLQAAENRDGAWKFIVNLNEKFKQGVRAELCSQKGKACKYAKDFPPNVSTRCVQKYIYRRLVAFDNDTVYNDNFKIPSCCVCIVTRHTMESGERRSGDAIEPLPLSLMADDS